jgi:cell wall-associated NlpC family hydrolase
MGKPDTRTAAWREDLAAAKLRGVVEAPRYAEPRAAEIGADVAPVHASPDNRSERITEALFGEPVAVYDERDGWSWVQIGTDDYVGYVATAALRPPGPAKTHKVAAIRTYLFAGPSLKSEAVGLASLGSPLAVAGEEGGFARLADGRHVWAGHIAPADAFEPDPVDVALRFLGAPYLWGGRTSVGLDCSALVQLCLAASGIAAPRDSDMQLALGRPLATGDAEAGRLRRGDLVFWKGHVGFAADAATLVHVNAHHMAVVAEPMADAIRRIAAAGLAVLACRRLGPA